MGSTINRAIHSIEWKDELKMSQKIIQSTDKIQTRKLPRARIYMQAKVHIQGTAVHTAGVFRVGMFWL